MDRDLEQTVMAALVDIGGRKAPPVTEIRPEHSLTHDLGFGSLDIAELVAVLHGELGVDPFETTSIVDARTVRDVIDIYRRHLGAPRG
jgi:acyl carrier protein